MRIQHNIMAMNAYRNYTNNVSAMKANLEKLSSGYKINRAGDDAAGLAISEKMRAQITGLETAQKNAKDGISLVQTAEGALTEVHDMLNRMVELATQSANGTYDNDTDRYQLQKEVNQLLDEINRIADSANFNGIKLLDGSMSTKSVSGAVYDALGSSDILKLMPEQSPTNNPDDSVATDGVKNKTILETDAAKSESTTFSIELDALSYTLGGDSTKASGESIKLTLNDDELTDKDGNSINLVGKKGQTIDAKTIAETYASALAEKGGITVEGVDYDVKAEGTRIVFTAKPSTDGTVPSVNPHYDVTLDYQAKGPGSVSGTAATDVKGGTAASAKTGAAIATSAVATTNASVNFSGLDANKIVAKVDEEAWENATSGTADKVTLKFDATGGKYQLLLNDNVIAESTGISIKTAAGAYATDMNTAGNVATVSFGDIGTITVTATNALANNVAIAADIDGTVESGLQVLSPANNAVADFSDLSADDIQAIADAMIEAGTDVKSGDVTLSYNADDGVLELKVGNTVIADGALVTSEGTVTLAGKDPDATTLTFELADPVKADDSALDDGQTYNADTFATAMKTGLSYTAPEMGVHNSTNVGVVNIQVASDGSNAQVANTTLDLTGKLDDGTKITLGDETYTIAIGNSAFKDVDNAVWVESADPDVIISKLTEVASGNKTFSVGQGEKAGTITLQQLQSVKDSTDMSTMDKLVSYIGVSTVRESSRNSVQAGKGLTLQIGDTADSYNKLTVDIGDAHAEALGIANIDISTQEGAATAMDKIKAAINTVSDIRGTLGATQNRLDHTINNLSVMTENIQDAESTIRDVDVAEEMMAYTKNNILIQSAQAMLAQANQVPQGVLQLLQ